MPAYETKLKLGRKLEGVDAATASDNQVSALFRYDDAGTEKHVSLSIESDAMGVEDVAAVYQLLHERGILRAGQSKTWVNQPQASTEKFGHTTKWGSGDLEQALQLLKHGLAVRPSGTVTTGQPGGASAKVALVKLGEIEKKLAELRQDLASGG